MFPSARPLNLNLPLPPQSQPWGVVVHESCPVAGASSRRPRATRSYHAVAPPSFDPGRPPRRRTMGRLFHVKHLPNPVPSRFPGHLGRGNGVKPAHQRCLTFPLREYSRIFSFPLHHPPMPPVSPSMARIVAIANQKGGVGKTTTAINLGASLAVAEQKTLIVDIDPQGNATSGLGIEKDPSLATVYDVLVNQRAIQDCTVKGCHFPTLDVVPSNRDLVGAELELIDRPDRERVLKTALDEVRSLYDLILVDCPPSLGLLTLNTLTAADSVLIPIQCEFYALEGLSQLLGTVRLVQRNLNPSLDIEGVLLTMFDRRLNLSRQVADEAREYFGGRVFETAIPRNVRLAEAPSFGQPIVTYDVMSAGAQSYLELARELLARHGDREGGSEPARRGARPRESA